MLRLKLSLPVLLLLISLFLVAALPPLITAALPGDANSDSRVDGIDYVIWLNHYNQQTTGASSGDFNNNGFVDGLDYVIWLNNYGHNILPSPSIPPPTNPPLTTPPVNSSGIWISQAELMSLPTSGSAWQSVLTDAASSWGAADVSDQNSNHEMKTLAGALVCARTVQHCDKTRQALLSAVGTEGNSRWLAIGRNMTGYTIAADLMRNKGSLSGADLTKVSDWLSSFLTRKLPNNNSGTPETLTPFGSGSNASAQEGAVYAAIAAYTGNKSKLDYVWNRFRLFSCDRNNNPEHEINIDNGFAGGWSHSADINQACAVNPKGAAKNGRTIDGVIINDMVRGGNFAWPPGYTQYPWVGIEGYVPAALILHRAGFPAFEVSNQAVLRTHEYLYYLKNNTSTDWWEPSRASESKHIVNVVYGKNYPVTSPVGPGRTVGYTDWTHPHGI